MFFKSCKVVYNRFNEKVALATPKGDVTAITSPFFYVSRKI